MIRQLLLIGGLLILFLRAGLGQTEKKTVHVPEYLVESRIEKLNLKTPLPLNYNEYVQAYIDVYTLKRPKHLSGILARSAMYFPLFEEYLDKYDLPLELKYLAVIESALDPNAKSSSGAYGLWQFLYQASRMFDLKVDSYIDERADPVKATDAACRYLKYLYANFNDWLLAIAAYNVGIGVVKDAIEKSGGEKNYWQLRPFLPEQVRGYVPAFVAANYAMNYYKSYNIEPASVQYSFDDLSTTLINGGISFQQITNLTGISSEILKLLNPVYKMNYIPVQSTPVRIVIPENKLSVFRRVQPLFKTENAPVALELSAFGDTLGRVRSIHIVSPGEFFHEIAMKYQCRVEDVMVWNNLNDKHLFAGQELIVWQPCLKKVLMLPIDEIDNPGADQAFKASIQKHGH
jgi:membrane-bound lytic murein transglycosylase D